MFLGLLLIFLIAAFVKLGDYLKKDIFEYSEEQLQKVEVFNR